MIKASDAIRAGRKMLGTPYADMDCIAFIRAVIRKAEGGVRDYRCEGTNWLWRSVKNTGKYRHLTWQQEGTSGACAGMLAFKRREDDIHHVGLVTGEGTVLHASSVSGMVVETKLDETWHLLGRHRYLETGEPIRQEEMFQDTKMDQEAGCAKTQTMLINNQDGYILTILGDWRLAQD